MILVPGRSFGRSLILRAKDEESSTKGWDESFLFIIVVIGSLHAINLFFNKLLKAAIDAELHKQRHRNSRAGSFAVN